jgi:drug/metabolite transporter (DMT)-like permease
MITPTPGLREEPAKGIAYILGAVALFSAMSALVKLMGAAYPVGQLMFFRNALALPPVLAILAGSGGFASLRTERLGGHFVRAATGIAAMGTGFYGLTVLPLVDATAISFSHPLFITLLAIPMLGERIRWHRGGAVVTGFIGVLVLTLGQEGFGQMAGALGIGAALANALLSAISVLLVRRLSATEGSASITAWQSIFATVMSACLLPLGWVAPPGRDLLLLCGIGLAGGTAQYWLTQAYRFGPAGMISAFSYTGIVWAVLFGALLWGERPGPMVLLGASIVIAAGLYVLHREVFLARRRAAGLPR